MHDQHGATNNKPHYLPATANTTLRKAKEDDPDSASPVEQKEYRGSVVSA